MQMFANRIAPTNTPTYAHFPDCILIYLIFRHLDLANLFKIDEDGNGEINKEEFIQVLGQFIPSVAEQEEKAPLLS